MTREEKEKFLKTAVDRLKKAIDADQHNRTAAIEDLKFLNGEQWDSAEAKRRSNSERPMLTVNVLPKFVAQVVGDGRQNKKRIKIRPKSSDANTDIAKIREGLIYDIEYQSYADKVYDQGLEMSTSCGYGGWRVLTKYASWNSFEQEVFIEPVPNPMLMYLEPDAKDQCGADANWGFLLDKMPREEYEDKYGKDKMPGAELPNGVGTGYEHWWDEQTITVAEYFVKEKIKKTVVLLSDGQVVEKGKAKKILEEDMALAAEMGVDSPLEVLKERETEEIVVKHYIISASEILEDEKVWPGQYVPLIPVYGAEMNIEGKRYVRGLIRFAKHSQQMLNYWTTLAAETIALAPKAPYIGTPKQFANFEEDWKKANVDNMPFLQYNPDEKAPGPPQRQPASAIPTGIFAEINNSMRDIDETIGMFKAGYGAPSNEKSGKAILARQQESDVATFVFIDNHRRAIEHTGRVINDIIPKIYDTPRDVRVRNIDDKEQFVPINTTVGNALRSIQADTTRYKGMNVQKLMRSAVGAGEEAEFNNVATGEYGVAVTVGPAYTTQRMEAAENLMRLVSAVPDIGKLAADLIARNLDFNEAEELAERFEKTLPPEMRTLREGEQPPPPPQPNPEQVIQMKQLEIEQQKLQVEAMKIQGQIVESKDEIRGMILEILNELHNPGTVRA